MPQCTKTIQTSSKIDQVSIQYTLPGVGTASCQKYISSTDSPNRNRRISGEKGHSAKWSWRFLLTAPQATPCGLLAPLLGVLHAVRLEARADSAGRLIAREQACSARAFHFRARWGRHADSPSTRTRIISNYAIIALCVETNSTLRHHGALQCACSLSGTRILKKLSADQCCPSLRLLHSRIADPCPAPPSRWRSQ